MTSINATSNLTPGATYSNVAQCALVLEDTPTEVLKFESFPDDGIEESYSVSGYREIAADRMSQPGFVAYRGGNWSSFNLVLKFRAGEQLKRQIEIGSLQSSDLEVLLLQMEARARWCQALAFPMERSATTFVSRIQRRAEAGSGTTLAALQQTSLGQLTRNDPPFVLVVFGKFLTLRCYVSGYSIKWTHPFHPVTVRPYGAEVTLSLQRLEFDYPTWKSIRANGGQRDGTPTLPRIEGDVVFNYEAGRAASNRVNTDNAGATSSARAGGAPSAAVLSVGPT